MIESPILAYSARDVREALPHWLLMRAGRRVENPNPIAEEILRSRNDHKTVDLAASITGRVILRGEDYAISLQEPSFAEALAGGLQLAISEGYGAIEPLPFFNAKSNNTKPKSFPRAFAPGFVESEDPHFEDFSLGSDEDGEQVSFRFWGAWAGIGRRELINDDFGGVLELLRQYGLAAGRLESRLFCEALESAANLRDGAPLFGIVNSVTGDMGDLAEALALLKTAPLANGEPANLRGKWLICHPKQESAAVAAVNDLTQSGQAPRLRVIGLPWLTSETTFYVLADPSDSPVVCRLGMLNSPGPTVNFHSRGAKFKRRGIEMHFHGLVFGLSHWFGVGAIGRRGAVRVQAA